jgi:stage V sporulation protein B
LVKLLGALFKIPLTHILGGGGMGYFMTAYGFFNPIYAMSIAGFPVAVSRMVSQSTACQSYRGLAAF